MKKAILFVVIALMVTGTYAQKLDKAKDLLKQSKLAEAKTEIDNFLAVEKNKNNSDAWYLKSKIYAAVGGDATLKTTVPDARGTAFEAVKQYMLLESTKKDSNQ